jgi:hypothetical protein
MKKIIICLSLLVLLLGCSAQKGDSNAAIGAGRYTSDSGW